VIRVSTSIGIGGDPGDRTTTSTRSRPSKKDPRQAHRDDPVRLVGDAEELRHYIKANVSKTGPLATSRDSTAPEGRRWATPAPSCPAVRHRHRKKGSLEAAGQGRQDSVGNRRARTAIWRACRHVDPRRRRCMGAPPALRGRSDERSGAHDASTPVVVGVGQPQNASDDAYYGECRRRISAPARGRARGCGADVAKVAAAIDTVAGIRQFEIPTASGPG